MDQRLRPDLFLLDPEAAHLNHGSYGSVPIPVLEAQRRAAESIERSPERFYRVDLAPAIDAVREEVASFLHTEAEGLALVENATTAVQVVLDAVGLEPGSEIVYTDHAYGWVKAAIARACARTGAVACVISLPAGAELSPAGEARTSAEVLLATLREVITKHTKLVVLDQITSASALRLPVEAVCAELGAEVPILIDGAHAPGLIDEPVPTGAAFWLGNLHKWAFAARTAAVLVVAPHYRERVRPLVASAGAADGFPRSFSYLGTRDPSAYLALPASLAFPGEFLGMSFAELRQRNAKLLNKGLKQLAERLNLTPAVDNGLPLRTVALGLEGDDAAAWRLAGNLREAGVEVAVTAVEGQLHARVSVQAYVGSEDLERLGEVLAQLLGVGRGRLPTRFST